MKNVNNLNICFKIKYGTLMLKTDIYPQFFFNFVSIQKHTYEYTLYSNS